MRRPPQPQLNSKSALLIPSLPTLISGPRWLARLIWETDRGSLYDPNRSSLLAPAVLSPSPNY